MSHTPPPPSAQTDHAVLHQHYLDMYAAQAQPPPHAGTSASAVASTSVGTFLANPAAPPKKPNRLPQQALAMLRDWYQAEPNPTARDKREMVAQIHALFPETTWYSLASLKSWISGRKQAERRLSKTEKKDTASILWPTLTKDKIETLRTLRKQKPAALGFEQSVRLWARALEVPEPHVEAWLNYNPEENDASPPEDRKPLHLPTPEATASPEPSHAHAAQSPLTPSYPPYSHPGHAQTTVKQQPYSPVQAHFMPSLFSSAAVSPQQTPVYSPTDPRFNTIQQAGPLIIQYIPPGNQQALQQQPPSLAPFTQQPAQPQPKPKVQIAIPQTPQPSQSLQMLPEPGTPALAQAITKGLSMSLKTCTVADFQEITVSSIEDFDKAFEPFGRMARELLERARRGAFAPIGLPADMPELAQDGGSEALGIDIDAMQIDQ